MRAPESLRRVALEVGYRFGGWPRRLAALLCLALAVVTALHDRPRAAARAAPVVVAARDLAAGTVLRPGDVELADWPPAQIPARALRTVRQAVGVPVAAAMDRGEPVTAARIRGTGITAGLAPGFVAATVTVANPNTLTFIRPGDRVDLLAAIPADIAPAGSPPTTTPRAVPSSGAPAVPQARVTPARSTPADGSVGSARVVASGVRVLAVVVAPGSAADDDSAGLVVAVDRTTALAIASVTDGSMTATLRMPP